MKCTNHPRVEAMGSCAECGKPICEACTIDLDHRAWCRDCLSRILAKQGTGSRVHPGWRKLAAGLLSIVPGAGHMFLGFIGKGFLLMGLLVVAVFFILLYSDATGMYWMTAYLIPTISVLFLSYAVFDSMAIADAQRSGREPPGTDDDEMKMIWERVLLNRRTLGWVIVLAGVVGILRLFADPFSRWTMALFSMSFPLAALVIPIVLLIIGILLLKRSRKEK
jgi:DNA-directed RNA polymerase subunit RPC12/RpoP